MRASFFGACTEYRSIGFARIPHYPVPNFLSDLQDLRNSALGTVTMYTILGKALVFHHKVVQYAKHVVPTHLNFIYRVDVRKRRVTDDLCARERPLNETQFYYIGGWDRHTGMYHRFYLSGAILKGDIGDDFWMQCSSRDLVKKLVGLYGDRTNHILAIILADVDVTGIFADIKTCIARPNNLTATSIAVLHQYLTSPHDSSFRAFAVEALTVDADAPPSPEAQDTFCEDEGDDRVTLVDYDLEEHHRSGDARLFVSV